MQLDHLADWQPASSSSRLSWGHLASWRTCLSLCEQTKCANADLCACASHQFIWNAGIFCHCFIAHWLHNKRQRDKDHNCLCTACIIIELLLVSFPLVSNLFFLRQMSMPIYLHQCWRKPSSDSNLRLDQAAESEAEMRKSLTTEHTDNTLLHYLNTFPKDYK